ncbi:MAG: bile acid:sodium symporter [Pirellulales bacterium]
MSILAEMDYQSLEYSLAASLLVCSMFGMGTTLAVRDLLDVFKTPSSLAIVLLLQCVISPTLALVIGKLFGVSLGVAAGMILITAIPGGSYTNLFTYFGRGNVALSVAATTFCTALCVVTTPLVLRTFNLGGALGEVVMPAGKIFFEIVTWLLLPLATGMLTRRFLPSRYALLGKVGIWASVTILVVLVIAAMSSGRLKLMSEGWRAPLAIIALGTAMLWSTYGTCLLAKRPLLDVFTIAIEVVVRNGNLALLLKASLYPDSTTDPAVSSGVLFAILFYAANSMFIALLEVYVCRTNWGVIYGRGKEKPLS